MEAVAKNGMNPMLKKGLIALGVIVVIVGAYFGWKYFTKDAATDTAPIDTGGDTTDNGTTDNGTTIEPTPTTPSPIKYVIKTKAQTPIRIYPSDLGEVWLTKPTGTVIGMVTKDEWDKAKANASGYMRLVYVPSNITATSGGGTPHISPTNLINLFGQHGINTVETRSNATGNSIPAELYVKQSNVTIASEGTTIPTGMVNISVASGRG
jgi:hypothetical protein